MLNKASSNISLEPVIGEAVKGFSNRVDFMGR